MPLLSRLFIRAGMVFFVSAISLSLIIQFSAHQASVLVPLFWHMLMFGWITQIIMGVSLWMFPGRKKDERFKYQMKPWLALYFLNTGLVFRIISEPFIHSTEHNILKILLIVSAILQLMAALLYVVEMWPRVISKKKSIKRRKQAEA